MIIDFLNAFLGITCIVILIRRFKNNAKGTLLNPLFYLCIFSVLYLILPSFYVDYALIVQQIYISDKSINTAKLYSFIYTFVFFIFYLFSSDYKVKLVPLKISILTYNIMIILWFVISLFLIMIILLYFRDIYDVRQHRALALMLYETNINSRFKLRILLYLHLCMMFILYDYKKSIIYLLPCLFYLILDYSHGGRTMSLLIVLYLYIIIVLTTGKHYLKYFFIAIILFILSGVVQRASLDQNIYWTLYLSGAEFSNTYITTVYMIDNPDISIQSGVEYIVVSISKVIPGGFIDKMLDFGEWYGDPLSEHINVGYGLAGNLITEALVYGGKYWAIINPFIIGLFLLILNKLKLIRNLWGFLFMLMLIITMQNISRSYFYGFIFYPLQMLILLFWTVGESKKQVLEFDE